MPSVTTAVPDATKLAVDRTRLAHERTLMAWVRTATSLISFVFTTYKFFQYLRESQSVGPEGRLFGPREFALLMIGIGVVALILATVEHYRGIQNLRERFGEVPFSAAPVLAIVMSLFGIVGLAAVFFRQ